MEQALPSNRCWAASFFSASRLVPGPQLEQVPSKFSLQTSQSIPQTPVGIRKTPFSGFRFQVSVPPPAQITAVLIKKRNFRNEISHEGLTKK